MIFGWIFLFGVIWLVLVLFEPFVTYMKAGAQKDHEYSYQREKDDERMRKLQQRHTEMSKSLLPSDPLQKKKSKRQLKREAWKARKKERRFANNSTDSKGLLEP